MVASKSFSSQNFSLKTDQTVDVPFWYTVLTSYDTNLITYMIKHDIMVTFK